MKKQIPAYILTRLFRAASEDDIIFSVCQKTGLDWEESKALVDQVKDEHFDEIEARQMPLKGLLSFLFFILGIILTIGPIIYLGIMIDFTGTLFTFVSGGPGRDLETLVKVLESRCVLLSWFELPSIIFTSLSGLAIIYGNLRYVRGTWITLFRNWNLID